MKKNRLFFMFAALFVTAAVMFSCQKEEVSIEKVKGNLELKNASFCVPTLPSSPITVWTETYTWGGQNQNSNTVTITVFNNDVNTTVKVTNSNEGMTLREAIPGLETTQQTGTTVYSSSTPGTYTKVIPHVTGWKCGDVITFSYYISGLGGGQTYQTGVITYNLRGLCTTTTLTAIPNPVCVGNEVVLTASTAVTSGGAAVTSGNLQIMEWIVDEWVPVGNAGVGTASLTYTPSEEGARTFKAVFSAGNKFCASETATDLVVDAEECGCDYEMTGEVECDGYLRKATFTYTPAEDGWLKLQGGLNKWAINVEYSPVGYQNFNSGASVGGWEGPVSACQEYTFIVTWEFNKVTGSGDGTRADDEGDGNLIGDWTAKLYEYLDMVKGDLISELTVDEIFECGVLEEGYVTFPVPPVE